MCTFATVFTFSVCSYYHLSWLDGLLFLLSVMMHNEFSFLVGVCCRISEEKLAYICKDFRKGNGVENIVGGDGYHWLLFLVLFGATGEGDGVEEGRKREVDVGFVLHYIAWF